MEYLEKVVKNNASFLHFEICLVAELYFCFVNHTFQQWLKGSSKLLSDAGSHSVTTGFVADVSIIHPTLQYYGYRCFPWIYYNSSLNFNCHPN